MAEITDIKEVIKQWPLKKLIALLVVFLLTVSGIGAMVWWAQTADYQVLYSNLSIEDASSVTDRLKEMKVPYRLESGGTAVLVPAAEVYDLRMQLAAGGLPRGGGVGFEIFDETKFGMTQFLQKVNFRRALQGELSRTIRQLSEVSSSRVHLSIPEKTIFSDNKEPTKASVVVTLRNGRSLSSRQVQGIVRLVASSVEGLQPDNVSVLNSAGELLSGPGDESFGTASSSQVEYTKMVGHNYEQRVQSMLDGMLGSGKTIVKVDVAFDFRRIERTEEKFDPDSAAIKSEQRTVEKSSGTSPSGGIPGVLSNVPGTTATAGKGGTSSSQRQNEAIDYELSKVISHIVEPTGMIKRLSVAVMVDGTYKAGDDGKDTYVPRTPEELKRYEDLVKTAVGFSQDRGDKLVLTNIPFQREYEEEMVEEGTDYAQYLPVVMKYLIPMAAMIMAFFLILKPMLNSIKRTPLPVPAGLPRSVAELEGLPGREALPGRGQAQKPGEHVTELVKQNPEQAVSIVKEWMNED